MKFNIKQEWPNLLSIALPVIYLVLIWNKLPDTVPTHWGVNGEIDDYGSKNTLLILPFMLPGLTYLILYFAPSIDPKNKLQNNPSKFIRMRNIIVLSMSAVALYIIYSTQKAESSQPDLILVLSGVIITACGNYMSSVKPNYFIGIRTPWTLENETVWRKTHQLASKFWFAGGLLIVLFSLTLSMKSAFIALMSIIAIISIIPLVYSYKLYQKLKS